MNISSKMVAALQGVCDNLVNALKLLANPHRDGESPSEDDGAGFARKKSAQNNGRAQKVHHGRHFLRR